MITTVKRPSRTMKAVRCFQGKKEKTFLGLFNLDFRRGKNDGKKAPAACQSSLATIMAEEQRDRDDFRGRVRQNIVEARTNLGHIDRLIEHNARQTRELEATGGLLPEAAALSARSAAAKELFLASALILCEIVGLTYVARSTFGQGLIAALVFASVFSVLVALGVKFLITNLSDENRRRFKWLLGLCGFILALIGLIGFVLLRTETFTEALTGGQLDFSRISFGNALCMFGLTVGLPLLCGVLYEDSLEKLNAAQNSLRLYVQRNRLQGLSNEWSVVLSTWEELDARLDTVTEQVIAARRGKYIRGFHIGAAKNPDAAEQVRLLNGQTA